MTDTDTIVNALRFSVAQLRGIVERLTDDDLDRAAAPSEWTIADVLSHVGSGALIHQRGLDDVLAGHPTPDDFAPGVWDEWNAKSSTAKRDDALAADAALLARIEAVTPAEQDRFSLSMGPVTVDFGAFVGLRLNEHAFHTWDIDVVIDPTATIPVELAELVVDNLELIARFTAKPTGEATTITVSTTDPERGFRIELTPEVVTVTPTTVPANADVELPAEAFARLVYGRLAPEHTPPCARGTALETLRRVFPGP
jgi:uncharacterized protein (TIGR03083 family)